MKDTFYFSHDYNARNDVKIKKLLAVCGFEGYGVYWAIIEDLYNNANAMPVDYDCIAYDMRVVPELLKVVIENFDLFVFHDGNFGSLSVQNRLDERDKKSFKARESANKRWEKKGVDAVVMQSQEHSNAIKERKGKEKKGKERKGKEGKIDLIFPYDSFDFLNTWNILAAQPKWKNKTIEALQGNLKTLSQAPQIIAIQMMQDTINNGWQGVFLPKNIVSTLNLQNNSKIQEMSNAYQIAKNKIENGNN